MRVVSVASRNEHGLGKTVQAEISLIAGFGVQNDAHYGSTVKHRSRVAKDPTQPNLRQVHIIHAELLDQLVAKGFTVLPGELGENILTSGVELLKLTAGTLLRLGPDAVIEITGLRNPCNQINGHSAGLMNAVIEIADDRSIVRKAGIMGVVLATGKVRPGDAISITTPDKPHIELKPV